jgi:DNA ligase-1
MLIALSRAFLLSRPSNANFPLRSRKDLAALKKEELAEIWSKSEEIVKKCFAQRPNYNDLIPILLEVGVCDELLIRCGLALHIPLRPMLGSITRDLSEMLTKLQGRDFSCKYPIIRSIISSCVGSRVCISQCTSGQGTFYSQKYLKNVY